MFSTDSEEIFVENRIPSFTKLLQAHTYNILHTWAARQKSFTYERLDSSEPCDLIVSWSMNKCCGGDARNWANRVSMTTMFYVLTIDLLIVGPTKRDTKWLRQTDGERFFDERAQFEIAKDFPRFQLRIRDS